jgi:sulfonate transport system substrate-binding protein
VDSAPSGPAVIFFRQQSRPFWGLVVLSAALAGCKAKAQASAAQPSDKSKYEPVVIRFSDPGNGGSGGVLAYARREGILERELAKVNAKIEWVSAFGAFSANFEAMNTGAINASGGAISPIVGALAHNLKFKVFAIADPSAQLQAGIIVPGDSPIKKIKDLVGKRVAVNLAAHGDYILLKALTNEGIPIDSVKRVAIQPPDAAAAFATGKIDAWSTFGVFFSTAVRNGARVLAHEADVGSDDVNVNAANVEVLEKNPAAFKLFIKVLNDLVDLAHKYPERFQNVFTDKGPTAVSGDELRLAIETTRVLPKVRVPTDSDRRRVSNVASLFFANKSIDRAISADEIVFDIDAAARRKGLEP